MPSPRQSPEYRRGDIREYPRPLPAWPIPADGLIAFLISLAIVVAAWDLPRPLARATGGDRPALPCAVGQPRTADRASEPSPCWSRQALYAELPRTQGLQLRRRLDGDSGTGGDHLRAEHIYTAAFIAENVRSGILAVSHGQTEAACCARFAAGPDPSPGIIPRRCG